METEMRLGVTCKHPNLSWNSRGKLQGGNYYYRTLPILIFPLIKQPAIKLNGTEANFRVSFNVTEWVLKLGKQAVFTA